MSVNPQDAAEVQAAAPPGVNVDAIIAQAVAGQAAGEAEGFSDDAIGGLFDPEFFGEHEVPGMRGAVPAGVPTTINRPFYKNGDEWRLVQGLAPEEFRRLQDRMKFIGLLDSFRPGEADEKTLTAISALMQISNRRGSNWSTTLTEYETNIQNGVVKPFGEEQDPKIQLPSTQLIPEYGTAARRVNSYFEQRLGRKATEAEMRMFTDRLMADYKAAAEQQLEQAAAEPLEITPGDDEFLGAGRVGFEEQINPEQRFENAFEQRFKGTFDVLERGAATQAGAGAAQAAVNATDQALG